MKDGWEEKKWLNKKHDRWNDAKRKRDLKGWINEKKNEK